MALEVGSGQSRIPLLICCLRVCPLHRGAYIPITSRWPAGGLRARQYNAGHVCPVLRRPSFEAFEYQTVGTDGCNSLVPSLITAAAGMRPAAVIVVLSPVQRGIATQRRRGGDTLA